MSRIRLVAAMTTVLLVGSGCSGSGDDTATGTTSSSSTTTTTPTSTTTTSTAEIALEWFATAWADEPELTDAGTGERRDLRYGLSGPELAQRAEAAVASGTIPEPPMLQLTARNELESPSGDVGAIDGFFARPDVFEDVQADMQRRSFSAPVLYVGRADARTFGDRERDPASSAEARLRVPPNGLLEVSGPYNSPVEATRLALAFAQLIPPLPDQPVGIGATWTASFQESATAVPPAEFEFEFTFVEDRGDQIVVKITSTSMIDIPFGRGGVAMRFVEQGTGRVVVDLTTARPIETGYEFSGSAREVNPPAVDLPDGEPRSYTRTLTVEIG